MAGRKRGVAVFTNLRNMTGAEDDDVPKRQRLAVPPTVAPRTAPAAPVAPPVPTTPLPSTPALATASAQPWPTAALAPPGPKALAISSEVWDPKLRKAIMMMSDGTVKRSVANSAGDRGFVVADYECGRVFETELSNDCLMSLETPILDPRYLRRPASAVSKKPAAAAAMLAIAPAVSATPAPLAKPAAAAATVCASAVCKSKVYENKKEELYCGMKKIDMHDICIFGKYCQVTSQKQQRHVTHVNFIK